MERAYRISYVMLSPSCTYVPRGSVVIAFWMFAWLDTTSGGRVLVAVVFRARGVISSRVRSVSIVRAAIFFVSISFLPFSSFLVVIFYHQVFKNFFRFIFCYLNFFLQFFGIAI